MVQGTRMKNSAEIYRDRMGLTDAEMESRIFGEIEAGGTLEKWCGERMVPFGGLMAWIRGNPKREERYHEAVAVRRERAGELFVGQLQEIATTDIRKMFDKENKLLPISEWPAGVGNQIKKIKFTDTGEVENLEFWSKISGLNTLGKSLGLLDGRKERGLSALEELLRARQEPKEIGVVEVNDGDK